MKHRRLLCTAAVIAGLSAGVAVAKEMQVQVRKTEVRDSPEIMGNVIGELGLGERVNTLVDTKGAAFWKVESLVRTRVIGWIRPSAVSEKKIELTDSGGSAKSVSDLEAAMAGKGIAGGEEKYVQTHNLQNAQAILNQLEADPLTKISVQDIRTFITEGRITQGGN
ncbi:MAG: hypothetical protein WD768_17285 [Phycisphaeraceae bacterium]